MVRYSSKKIKNYLSQLDHGRNMTEKGRALEDLTQYMFENIPGFNIVGKNIYDPVTGQEIDLVFWIKPNGNSIPFPPGIIFVECKNYIEAVDGKESNWFIDKLKKGGGEYGVLVARNGITGNEGNPKGAYSVIKGALRDRIKIIVITTKEIENITDTDQFVELLDRKLRNLMVPVKVR